MLHLQGGGAGQLVTPMLRQRLCKYYIITHGKSNLTSFTKTVPVTSGCFIACLHTITTIAINILWSSVAE